MIGPSLYRINHIPLAEDYNRVVEAVSPLQNLAVGGNLAMEQLNNGLTLIGLATPPPPEDIIPFTCEEIHGNFAIYVPYNSIVLNGCDYTFMATSKLSATDVLDWYIFPGDDEYQTLYLFVEMMNYPNRCGSIYDVTLSTGYGSSNTECLKYEIYDRNKHIYYHKGQFNKEIIRPDTSQYQSSSVNTYWYNSIEYFTDDAFDKTIQLNGFTNNVATKVPLGTDDYIHTFAVREEGPDHVELRWTSLDSIRNYLSIDNPDWLLEFLDEHWWQWYNNLSDNPLLSDEGLFWERGANSDINYGGSIGDNNKKLAIDIDYRILYPGYYDNAWYSAGDFIPLYDVINSLGSFERKWLNLYSVFTSTSYIAASPDDNHIKIQSDLTFPNNTDLGTEDDPVKFIHADIDGAIYFGDKQVICKQQAAIANATNSTDVVTQFNDLLSKLRIHGLIAT